MKFELKPYNHNAPDEELLLDLQSVAQTLNKPTLTEREYNGSKINRFHSGTIRRRFSSWNSALIKAGLRIINYTNVSDEDLLNDLKDVARKIAPRKVVQRIYNENGKYSAETIHQRFGWNNALKIANLPVAVRQNISDEELFNNLEEIWIKLGRQPGRRDMVKPFSKFSEKPYMNRFGTWRKALEAFVEYVRQEEGRQSLEEKEIVIMEDRKLENKVNKTKRDINLRQRFIVMKRDNFKCKNCGRSPATDPQIILHVDHIQPWSKGGETVIENLQTLCSLCNLGKSNVE